MEEVGKSHDVGPGHRQGSVIKVIKVLCKKMWRSFSGEQYFRQCCV